MTQIDLIKEFMNTGDVLMTFGEYARLRGIDAEWSHGESPVPPMYTIKIKGKDYALLNDRYVDIDDDSVIYVRNDMAFGEL